MTHIIIDMTRILNKINEPNFLENFLFGFICGYIVTLLLFLMAHEVSYLDKSRNDKKTK